MITIIIIVVVVVVVVVEKVIYKDLFSTPNSIQLQTKHDCL